MNNTTLRTATPDTHLRNLRGRQAQLAYKDLMRTITSDEQKELNELRVKISKLENDLKATS